MRSLPTQITSKPRASTLSSKGQITLPIEIRKHLGLSAYDKVAFVIELDGTVQVTPDKYPDIASMSGAAGSLKKSLSWKEIQQIAREDRLKEKYDK